MGCWTIWMPTSWQQLWQISTWWNLHWVLSRICLEFRKLCSSKHRLQIVNSGWMVPNLLQWIRPVQKIMYSNFQISKHYLILQRMLPLEIRCTFQIAKIGTLKFDIHKYISIYDISMIILKFVKIIIYNLNDRQSNSNFIWSSLSWEES